MNDKYLVAIGTSCIDEYYALDDDPVLGTKVTCEQLPDQVGGMISNAVAVYAAYRRPAYLIDHVNGGAAAQKALHALRENGVETSYVRVDDTLGDAKCIILLRGGERLIVVIDPGKRDIVLDAAQNELLEKAEYVYTSVPELQALQNAKALIARWQAGGAKLVLDVEQSTVRGTESDKTLLQAADVLILNDTGAARVAERYGGNFAQSRADAGCVVVNTLGPEGCRVLRQNAAPIYLPAIGAPVVDTTGAGDTFNASFLYGLSEGWQAEKSAVFANAAAARAIGIIGPRSGAVGAEEVFRFIENSGVELPQPTR